MNQERSTQLTQDKYVKTKYFGLLINFILCLLLAIFRYILVINYDPDTIANSLLITNFLIVLGVQLFLLVSAILLAVALHLYKKAFVGNPKYQQNKFIMYINLMVAVGHMLVEVLLVVLLEVAYIKETYTKDYAFPTF